MAPTLLDADNLARDASRALRTGNRTVAREKATQSAEIAQTAEGTNEKRSEILHKLAGTFRGLGDDKQCEALARAAIKAEEQCDRPQMLGNHLMFLADFLHERGRTAEAAAFAHQAVPRYEKALGPQHPQTARVRADAERFAKPPTVK